MIKCFYWVESKRKILKSDEFKASYGAVIDDIKLKGYAIYFYPLYLYRRLIYAGLIIILFDYPEIQLILIIILNIIPVSVY